MTSLCQISTVNVLKATELEAKGSVPHRVSSHYCDFDQNFGNGHSVHYPSSLAQRGLDLTGLTYMRELGQ
jgi:hypothetical protein